MKEIKDKLLFCAQMAIPCLMLLFFLFNLIFEGRSPLYWLDEWRFVFSSGQWVSYAFYGYNILSFVLFSIYIRKKTKTNLIEAKDIHYTELKNVKDYHFQDQAILKYEQITVPLVIYFILLIILIKNGIIPPHLL